MIYPNDGSDFLISLVGNLNSISDNSKNHTYIKNDVKHNKKLIEILNRHIPSNEIFNRGDEFKNDRIVKSFYISDSKKKIYDTSNVVLFIEIDNLIDTCGSTYYIFVFDISKARNILFELKDTYGNQEVFETLIKKIKNQKSQIEGVVRSSVNNKLVTKKVYIHEPETNQTVKADENGKFIIRNLKRNGNYTLIINAYNYLETKFQVKINDRVVKKYFDLKGNCELNKKSAIRDWNNGTPKLLLKPYGIVGNSTNRSFDNDFELKYNIEYVSFGCMPPKEKCIKEYNIQIFKLLDKKYGKKWRMEARYDVAYLDKKDVKNLEQEQNK